MDNWEENSSTFILFCLIYNRKNKEVANYSEATKRERLREAERENKVMWFVKNVI